MQKTRNLLLVLVLSSVFLSPLGAASFSFGADQTHVTKNSKELKGNAFYESENVYIRADLIQLPETGPISLEGNIVLRSKEHSIMVESMRAHFYKEAQLLIVPAWGRIVDPEKKMVVQAGYMSLNLAKQEIELSIDARIWQEENNIIGRADKIDVKEDSISFFGDAELKQNDNSYQAQHIVFDRKSEKVILFGNVEGQMQTDTANEHTENKDA